MECLVGDGPRFDGILLECRLDVLPADRRLGRGIVSILTSMEIIAHRGASHDAPENTLAAIELGWRQGADAVEIDVRLSADGRLVVIHDDNTRRTAGWNKSVARQTLAELRRLDAGSWKGARWRGERIPTLAEALDSIPSGQGKRLFVEIKCPASCVPEFVRVFKASGKRPTGVVPIGFDRDTMRLLKSALPRLETARVVRFDRNQVTARWTPRPADVIKQIKQAGLDGLDCGANGPINRDFVARAHGAGLKVYVWTVDKPEVARRLRDCGIDGLTTNRPGWLREQLKGGISPSP